MVEAVFIETLFKAGKRVFADKKNGLLVIVWMG